MSHCFLSQLMKILTKFYKFFFHVTIHNENYYIRNPQPSIFSILLKGTLSYLKLQLLKNYSYSGVLSHLFHNHYRRKKKTETKNGREQYKMIKFTKVFKKWVSEIMIWKANSS